MITAGNLLLFIVIALVTPGSLRYIRSRTSIVRSRSAVLTVFAYGTFVSTIVIISMFAIHFHSISLFGTRIHLHNVCPILQNDLITTGTLLAVLGVYCLAFSLNQGVARRMLRNYRRQMDPSLSEELSKMYLQGSATLYVIEDESIDAFSMALFRLGKWLVPNVQNVIILTTGAVNMLEPDELEAVIAHEASHLRNGDNRYLPFFNTLSTLIFFDPLVRYLSERLFRGSEFTADLDAAIATKPLALAKALLKAYTHGRASFPVGFLGHKKYSLLLERINRLLTLENILAQCTDGHVHKRFLASSYLLLKPIRGYTLKHALSAVEMQASLDSPTVYSPSTAGRTSLLS